MPKDESEKKKEKKEKKKEKLAAVDVSIAVSEDVEMADVNGEVSGFRSEFYIY
jgi:hypothetical protein